MPKKKKKIKKKKLIKKIKIKPLKKKEKTDVPAKKSGSYSTEEKIEIKKVKKQANEKRIYNIKHVLLI